MRSRRRWPLVLGALALVLGMRIVRRGCARHRPLVVATWNIRDYPESPVQERRAFAFLQAHIEQRLKLPLPLGED